MSVIRKRFIAGALCPKCKSQDTLIMWQENKVDRVECVECGDQQQKTDDQIVGQIKQQQIIEMFTPE